MRVHDNWETPGLDLPPVAERIGPFGSRSFLRAATADAAATVEIVESDNGVVVIERHDGLVTLAGAGHITDYHTPLGTGVSALVESLAKTMPAGVDIDFDSLPEEAARDLATGLSAAGVTPHLEQHAATAILTLAPGFDDYLAGLSKKQRHETRRKLRRFEESVGSPRLVRESGADVVAMFADLHRRSSGDKGEFMTEQMERYFVRLHKEVGAVIDVLYGGDDRPTAAAFGFEDDSTYYLYNSAYELEVAAASPGITLVASLIRGAIGGGRDRVDFLKGDEAYKFRMGAMARPLYRIRGVVG